MRTLSGGRVDNGERLLLKAAGADVVGPAGLVDKVGVSGAIHW